MNYDVYCVEVFIPCQQVHKVGLENRKKQDTMWSWSYTTDGTQRKYHYIQTIDTSSIIKFVINHDYKIVS